MPDSGWVVSKDGKTRSQIAKEREARPEIKALRRVEMAKRMADPVYKEKLRQALMSRKGVALGPMSFSHRMALRAPFSTRIFSEIEASWLGAFIEADGSAFIRHGIHPIVVVTQNEVEIISTCLRITQTGSVQLGKGDCWYWTVAAYENALYIAQRAHRTR